MAVEVILPKWGLTMEEGTVSEWRKQEGEAVAEDEIIAEVETDKITNELPAPTSGILAKILVQAGETVEVGRVLALIAESEEEASRIRSER
ncbi:MAG: biotin attachment protein [Caldilinea sp.]|nr:biotin attachment protein [Caldilinea sp.]MDW8440625.1 biotin/lipoyl-containing protein [Caldilineaceae bacterium]